MKKLAPFYIAAVLSLLFYVMVISGLMGLIGDHGVGKDGNAHIVHHLGSSLILGLIVSGLILMFFKKSSQIAGLQQVVATILGFVVMGFIVGDPDNYGNNVAIFDLANLFLVFPVVLLVALHPDRKRILWPDFSKIKKSLLLLYSTILIPFFVYGFMQSIVQRNSYPPLSDIHHQHWLAMSTVAFAIIFVGFVGALRSPGYLMPMGMSAFSLLVLGIVSVLAPHAASSLGTILGGVSILSGSIALWIFHDEAFAPRSMNNKSI